MELTKQRSRWSSGWSTSLAPWRMALFAAGVALAVSAGMSDVMTPGAMAQDQRLAAVQAGAPQQTTPQPATAQPAGARDAVTATYALGEVSAVDPAGHRITIKSAGGDVAVTLEEGAKFLRLAPGETTLENAETIAIEAIGVGDRVMARGKVSDDRRSASARQIIVMSRAAIARKQEQERAEWQRRSIAGTVTAIDPAAKKITARVRSQAGPGSSAVGGSGLTQEIVITVPDKTVFRRYAPDSARFADARPSTFDELRVGDVLRALGEKGADGSTFKAETIVSGSFVMVGGPILAVRPEAGELEISDLGTKKPRTIVVNKDTMLRRIPPPMAMMLARRLSGPEAAGQTPVPAPPGAEGSVPPAEPGRQGPGFQGAAGGGQGGPGGMRRRNTAGPDSQPQPEGAPVRTGEPAEGQGGQAAGPRGMGGQVRMRGDAAQGGGPGGAAGFGQRAGGPPDVQEILERLPSISVGDLKPGEVVLVSAAAGPSPDRVTALVLASGVEALLAARSAVPGAPVAAGEGSLGLPGDMLQFEIGMPPQ